MSQKWRNHGKQLPRDPPCGYQAHIETETQRIDFSEVRIHSEDTDIAATAMSDIFWALILTFFSYGVIFQRIKHNDFFVGDNFGRFHPKVCYLKVPWEKQRKFWHCPTMRNNFPKKKVFNFYEDRMLTYLEIEICFLRPMCHTRTRYSTQHDTK